MLRALIVDDEPLAVERLERILSEISEIEVCHTSLNSLDAYEYVKTNPIDIVFLDILMPGMGGMKLSSFLLELNAFIYVVFVTAHEDYAIQAFDLGALDYLLKPVTVKRMSKTLDKIRKRDEYPRNRQQHQA